MIIGTHGTFNFEFKETTFKYTIHNIVFQITFILSGFKKVHE